MLLLATLGTGCTAKCQCSSTLEGEKWVTDKDIAVMCMVSSPPVPSTTEFSPSLPLVIENDKQVDMISTLTSKEGVH